MDLRSLFFNVGFKGDTSGIKAMDSAADKLKKDVGFSMTEMSGSSGAAAKNMSSQAATLAAAYRKAGMDSSSAFTKAWSEIERSSKTSSESVKKSIFGIGSAANSSSTAMSGLTKKLLGLAAAIGLVSAAGQIINMADGYQLTSSRINLMNDGMQTSAELQKKLYAAALDTHSEYQSTADAVSKLGITTGAAFSSSDEIIDFVSQVNKQFKIGGTSIEGQSAAMLQLTQAMSSGVLRGDELRSIYENAPTLIQSMADYMGVPVEQMRDLAEQGLITTDVIKNGVLGAAAKTDEKFASLGVTFGQVWTDFKTKATIAFQPVIEKLNELSNSEGFKTFTDNVINGLSTLGPAMVDFAQGLIDAFNSPALQSFGDFIKNTIEVAGPILEKMMPSLVGIAAAITAWSIATTVMTGVQWALNAALTANPIGAIVMAIIALVAGIVYLWNTNEGFRNAIIGIWSEVSGFLVQLWDNIVSGLQQAGQSISVIWSGIVNGFQAAVTGIQTAWGVVVGFFQGIWAGIVAVFNGVIGFFVGIYTAEWNGIMGIWNGAVGFFSGIVSGIQGAFSGISGFITGAFDGAMAFMSELPGKFLQWGSDMINGLIEGIKAKLTGAVEAIKGVATSISDAFTQFFEIHSPSGLFRDFGYRLPEGGALGILDGIPLIKKAMSGLLSNMGSGAGMGIGVEGKLANADQFIRIPAVQPSGGSTPSISRNNAGASSGAPVFNTTFNINVPAGSDAKFISGTVRKEWDECMNDYVKKLNIRNPKVTS